MRSQRILSALKLCVLIALVAAVLLWPQPGPASASGVAAVAAGGFHTCVVTAAGGVKCWGLNDYSQLGDGTTGDSSTPVEVVGLSSDVAAIAVGGRHTCALTTAGGVKCWGWNRDGQLGDGTMVDSSTPVDVVGLGSGVAAVDADIFHTCALTTAGGVKCWGWNQLGQLGDGESCGAMCAAPVDVVGLGSGVAAVAAGGYHTCALTTAGGVKCWGWNGDGQLGDGTTVDSSTPVDVVGLGSRVAALVPGDFGRFTCALTTTGGVKCWGATTWAEPGDDSTAGSPTPVDKEGLDSGVEALSAGQTYACALTTTGGVKCWGYNGYGQLGDGTKTDSAIPVDVARLESGVVAVAAGSRHTCALTTAGGVRCWGNNNFGQLGDGTFGTDRTTSVDVVRLKPMPGDVNCDGNVNGIDAALVLQIDAGLIDSLACRENADVSGDSDINSIDAALILQCEVGIPNTFCPET